MYPNSYPMNTPGGTEGEQRSQQNTPPLVFTTQYTGPPRLPVDSPSLEPLQIPSYSAVLGGSDFSLTSPSAPRRPSTTQLQVPDSPIRVTCRTRDGRRSPILTLPSNTDTVMEPTASNGNPYGFSFSGRSSPIQASTPVLGHPSHSFPTGDSGRTSPVIGHQRPGGETGNRVDGEESERAPYTAEQAAEGGSPTSPLLSEDLPSEVVHRKLAGRCRFVPFPPNLPASEPSGKPKHGGTSGNSGAHRSDSQGQPALFIGQVRFETTPAELIWLVHRTSGACATHLEGRGAGCYLLYCKSESDLRLVRSLHKRVLFDVGGVWLARTAVEIDALCEYVALDAPLLSRKAHLPRDSMVVEELKADAPSAPRGSPAGAAPMPPQYGGGKYPQHMPPQGPPAYQPAPMYGNGMGGMYMPPGYGAPPGPAGSMTNPPPPPYHA